MEERSFAPQSTNATDQCCLFFPPMPRVAQAIRLCSVPHEALHIYLLTTNTVTGRHE